MNKIIRPILSLQVVNIGIDIISASFKFSKDCEFFKFLKGCLSCAWFHAWLIISGKHFVCSSSLFYWGQPKTGTGLKMQFVPFVFSKSRFQGPAFRCDKIVVIVTLLEAIEGIPDKDYKFLGNENFHNLYERLLHEENLRVDIRGTYLWATTALESEPFIENQSEHISKLSLHNVHQSLVKRKFTHWDF